MREMRLHKREIHAPEIFREILEECEVVRLGLQDEEGMFIVPVNFGYDLIIENEKPMLSLYIHGAGAGRKADAFGADPRVAVEMDCCHEIITGDYTCSYSYAYRSIMGNGVIRKLEDPEEKVYGLAKIMEHLAPEAKIEFSETMLDRTEVFRIDVKSFTGKERRKK